MTVVIKSWRSNRYLSGTRICDKTGRADSWGCDTIDRSPFVACSWFGLSKPAYITQGCYNGLTDAEKAACVSRYAGIVTDSGHFYIYSTAYYNRYKLDIKSLVKCFSAACVTLRPDLAPDPCDGVVCPPECVGVDLYETVCEDGECVRGALKEANNIVTCGYVKPVCDEGDKRPGEICRDGDWVPYTPEEIPGEGRLYVKFAIPYLDMLPWIPYEPWMWIPPGFEVVEVP